MNGIKLHYKVTLTKNMKTTQFVTDKEIILPRGKVGTVVEIYEQGKAFEVEFANKNGQTYVLISLELEKLMLLHIDCSNLTF
ncbi:MAG: DUF4926 domain-containing protein [Okeania sp. SIO2C2]|uniref:DUF4926 domain-containing protein n=1 Tax=Okeania sp. SIO2C2 TaxID=2607787 RepID=UPI0013BB4498|nr:DUF4926 domain-containing protein [Okeania sp. SIO2C2]NEP87574.1 DUF4926 domain-containing protein [Okeania sp. SIO2C2]